MSVITTDRYIRSIVDTIRHAASPRIWRDPRNHNLLLVGIIGSPIIEIDLIEARTLRLESDVAMWVISQLEARATETNDLEQSPSANGGARQHTRQNDPPPAIPSDLAHIAIDELTDILGGAKDGDPAAVLQGYLDAYAEAKHQERAARTVFDIELEDSGVTHACPRDGEAYCPCCKLAPDELPRNHHITMNPSNVRSI